MKPSSACLKHVYSLQPALMGHMASFKHATRAKCTFRERSGQTLLPAYASSAWCGVPGMLHLSVS